VCKFLSAYSVAAYEEQERDAQLATLDVGPSPVIRSRVLILRAAAEPVITHCLIAHGR
jgi:hypothetical protein